jgi:hypothetical protein
MATIINNMNGATDLNLTLDITLVFDEIISTDRSESQVLTKLRQSSLIVLLTSILKKPYV